ncbi:hypothetical protein [Arabiibacter massiliensis]|uniref:hypothetical protein n=1 Tax=Arabiibacter massiliensis TaxID=1870985 RepID=UPI0009BB1CCF|nr:hypothetical protein [Arabiibacter massiliensis]
MKKIECVKRGIVGVCAATLLTGLCAGSAFAAASSTEPAQWDAVNASNQGKTEVSADVDAQVQATVPISFTAAVNADGSFTLPNNIELRNASTLAKAHVSAISVTEVSGKLIASGATAADPNSVKMTVNSFDLSTASSFAATAAGWEIPAATNASTPGTLPLTFAGTIANPSQTGAIHLFDITWTVAFGGTPTA